MRKKGQQSETVKLISMIIAFVLLLVFSTRINAELRKTSQRDLCRTSIGKAEALSGKGGIIEEGKEAVLESFLSQELECEMQIIDISKRKLPKDWEKAADFIMEKFADASYDGWYVTNKGNYKYFVPHPHSCLLVARINLFEVSDVLKEKDMEGFEDWMKNHNIPNSDRSYHDFISHEGDAHYPVLNIDPEKNYYVFVKWDGAGKTPRVLAYSEEKLINGGCNVFLN